MSGIIHIVICALLNALRSHISQCLQTAVSASSGSEDDMFFSPDEYRYYIRPGMTDMRKGVIRLASFVRYGMRLSVTDKAMFLFCGSNRKMLRVLVWDGNGFWLMTKRLVSGTYCWPESEEEAREIGVRDVNGLLEGRDVFRRLPVFGDIVI